MKKRLSDYPKLHKLRRNTKLQSELCYLLISESTANSLYFENKGQIKYAHNQIRKHLAEIIEVVDYLFTPNGWGLLVEVKSTERILQYYSKRENKSETIETALQGGDISRLISEAIRYTIANIAKYMNRTSRRLGAVVRENFSRYIFGSVEDAEEVMTAMKRGELDLCNQGYRYVPKLAKCVEGEDLLGEGCVYLNTRRMREGEEGGVGLSGVVVKNTRVLRKSIKLTLITHFHQITTQNFHFYPKIE